MPYFNEENTVEQMLVNAAGKCGWIYLEPQQVPRLPDEVLVTADTVVVLGNQLLGKPHSREEASDMLHNLSGRAHQVYTGVCLRSAERSIAFTEGTDVHFRQLTDDEIDYYIDVYKPYDKAGAYGIQEWIGMIGIERIEGCYYNVMGLPLARLYRELVLLTGKEAVWR